MFPNNIDQNLQKSTQAESAKRTSKIAAMICRVRKKGNLAIYFHGDSCLKVAPDLSGRKLDLLRQIATAGLSKTNACRNLHTIINRNNILFPVKIDAALISVAYRKPVFRREKLWWPIIRMDAWVTAILKDAPQMLLCGFQLKQVPQWNHVLRTFWANYFKAFPGHCLRTAGHDPGFCIPYFFHGDEGRGFRYRPVMVESFQPVISWKGPNKTNESGYLDYIFVFKKCSLFDDPKLRDVKYFSYLCPCLSPKAFNDDSVLADCYLILLLWWWPNPGWHTWWDYCWRLQAVLLWNRCTSPQWKHVKTLFVLFDTLDGATSPCGFPTKDLRLGLDNLCDWFVLA